MWSNILDRISYLSLFLVVVLLPIFCLPFTKIPVETSKGLLLVVGLAISVIFWSVARFSDGKITIPKSPILLSGLVFILVLLASAFFSSGSQVSFFGTIFDVSSFYFMFTAFLLMFVSSVMIKNHKNAQALLFGVVLSTTVVMMFQILRFFFPTELALGILGDKMDNLVGSWNSLGLVAGLSCLSSLFIIEFFPISRLAKYIFGFLILIALFVIVAVSNVLIWEMLGLFALMIFVYKISFFSQDKTNEVKIHFPAFSFVIVMVSLLFFMSGVFISGFLPNKLGLSNVEVSPSFTATMSVTKGALKADPFLGIGPNRFGEIWSAYKPMALNGSIFWDTYFTMGSGLIPTFIATTGYLGILSLFIFFVLFILAGFRSLFVGVRNNMHREILAFFILALYLFIASFFYAVGPVIILLAFVFTGVFIGLFSNREKGEIEIVFLNDHRKSFFFILSLILIMILSAAATFKYIERFASVSYFGKTFSAPSISEAEVAINKAISLHPTDLYMRAYSQVYLLKLNSLLNKDTALTDEEKLQLQASFDNALRGALSATTYNANNYLNFQTLGNVYSTAGVLKVEKAYEKAVEAYEMASNLNPINPGIELSIARAYYADGNAKQAKVLANKALELKPNYVEALIMLSQIAKNEGSGEALSYAERALSINPTNKDLIEYVNSLKAGN